MEVKSQPDALPIYTKYLYIRSLTLGAVNDLLAVKS